MALISEFEAEFAADNGMTMDELYEAAKKNALDLTCLSMFRNTILVLGKKTGFEEGHEGGILRACNGRGNHI